MMAEDGGANPIVVDVHSMTSEQRKRLGGVISSARAERSLSAMELSELSGVDRKTIRSIERGTRAGQPAKLHALLEALGIPQVGDFDSFSKAGMSFIFSVTPLFERVPDADKGSAQAEVATLLRSKLRDDHTGQDLGVASPTTSAPTHPQATDVGQPDDFSSALSAAIREEMDRVGLTAHGLGRRISRTSQYVTERLHGGSRRNGKLIPISVYDLALISGALGVDQVKLINRANTIQAARKDRGSAHAEDSAARAAADDLRAALADAGVTDLSTHDLTTPSPDDLIALAAVIRESSNR